MSKEKINLMVDGGKASAGAELGQKLGPLRINIQDVLAAINNKTSSFSGMQVPVKLIVDTNDKSYEVEVGSPPVSQLVKKELSLEKGSGEPHLNKIANIGIEQVIRVAKMKQDSMLVKDLKAAVKNVIGTCNSLGILIEGKEAKETIEEINKGVYDQTISAGITEISEEKKQHLATQLEEIKLTIKKEQERLKELEEAEKQAAPTEEVAEKPTEAKAEEKPEEKKAEESKKE